MLRPWTASEPVRLISSLGVSGLTHPGQDLNFTIGFGTRVSYRFARYVTLGIHDHVLLGNWNQVQRYYDYIVDCEKIDTRCDRRSDYWAIGWALALSSAQAGWDVMLRSEGPNKPWLSAGSSVMVFSSNTGFASDRPNQWVIAHTGNLGAGYDFEVIGFGLRLSYTNDSILFASNGPHVLNVLFSIDVLLPRDHEDRTVGREP